MMETQLRLFMKEGDDMVTVAGMETSSRILDIL